MASSAFYQAFVEIVPEAKNLRKNLAKEFESAGPEAGRSAGKGINSGILGSFKSLAAPLALAFAGLGVGKLLSDSIAGASDLAEAGTAITAVFGDADATIQKFAASSAVTLGQSTNQTLDAARVFGVFGKAAGLGGQELATFSTDFITLAADLASFNNTTPEAAIEALGAGLRGESEPLRQFGILLDDATLKARAAELGIYSGTGALTQQQRVLASQAEIMAQTSLQQGDFAKTSGGLANQQRILAAQLENTKVALGEALLPAMTSLATMANDTLVPILNDLVVQLGPVLTDALTTLAPSFTELLTALVPLIPNLVTLVVAVLPLLVDLLNLMSPALIAVTGWAAGFWSMMGMLFSLLAGDVSLQQFGTKLLSLEGPFGDVMRWVFNTLAAVRNFVTGAVSSITNFASSVGTKIGEVGTFFTGLPGKIIAAVAGFGSLLFDAGKNLVQGLINGIKTVANTIAETVLAPVRNAVDGVKSFLGIKSPSRLMFGIGVNTGEGLINGLKAELPGATSAMASLVSIPNVSPRIDSSVYGSHGTGGSNSSQMVGNLYLDSGELLGVIRGEVNAVDDGNWREMRRGKQVVR